MKLPIICLVIFVAGCATYTPKPLEPALSVVSFESRTLDNPELKKFLEKNLGREVMPWPPKSWDLYTLTLTAFYYHPDLDVARARWGVTEAERITAGQRPNPDFSFIPQHHSNTAGGLSPWTLGFNLDIPIETAGKRGYRIARAEKLSNAARLNIAGAAWQVRSRLESRIFGLYAAREMETVLERENIVQAELVRLLEGRLTAGEASLPDVTQARLALEQTRLLLVETHKELAEFRAALASALGVPLNATEGINLSFDFIDESHIIPSAPGLRRQALTNRPDILAVLAEYEAAEAALQLEIAKQYPDVRLGPGYQWDQGDNVWSLGFSVKLPVFNRNQGPIAEAEARRKETAARFTALQARVIGEIDQTLAGYRVTLDKLATVDALLSVQQARQKSMEALFKAGETDRLAFTSAVLELESASLARVETFARVLQARRALEDALQRPLAPSEPFPANVEENPRPEKENGK